MKTRGSLVFVAGSLSWAIAQWFLVWLFARFAGGAAAVGEYALALAVTTPVFIFGHFGLRTIYLTLRKRHTWSAYLWLRCCGITLSVMAILGYLLIASTNNPWIWIALIFQKSVDSYLDLFYGRIQRQNQLLQIGRLGIVKTIGTMAVAAVVILTTQSVALAVFGAGLISALVAILANRSGTKMDSDHLVLKSKTRYREILRPALPITATEALASVSNYLPLLFLGILADEKAAGIFAAVSYLFSVAHIAGAILRNVLITSLRWTFEEEGFGRLLHRSHRIALLLGSVGLVAAPVVVYAGTPVLVFLYGPGFTFTYGELAVLAIGAISIAPSYIYSALLNVTNQYDSQMWSLIAALIFGSCVGVILTVSFNLPALVIALAVALATNWGRLAGVLALTLVAQYHSRSSVMRMD